MNIRTIKHLCEEVRMPLQGYEKEVFIFSIPTVVLSDQKDFLGKALKQ